MSKARRSLVKLGSSRRRGKGQSPPAAGATSPQQSHSSALSWHRDFCQGCGQAGGPGQLSSWPGWSRASWDTSLWRTERRASSISSGSGGPTQQAALVAWLCIELVSWKSDWRRMRTGGHSRPQSPGTGLPTGPLPPSVAAPATLSVLHDSHGDPNLNHHIFFMTQYYTIT